MTDPKHEDLVQTHEDIPEIPEGVEVSNSVGSEEPDEGDDFEPEDYSDVDLGDVEPITDEKEA